MVDDALSVKRLEPGALIKFHDIKYGFVRGEDVELVDNTTVKVNGDEISTVFIRYLNDRSLPRQDGMEELAESARNGIGRAIRKKRKELDMIQEDFSMSIWTVSEVERGLKMPRYATIKKIAQDMDMTWTELLSKASLEMWRDYDE